MPSNPTRERGQRRAFALTHSFTTVSERAADIALSGSYRLTKSARARSHAARSGVHAEARRWSTSPPHHLTTLPHHGERNTRTRQRRATLNSAPKRPAICCKIWLVRCNSKRLPRARSLAARFGVLMEARRWCLVALAIAFVNLFW